MFPQPGFFPQKSHRMHGLDSPFRGTESRRRETVEVNSYRGSLQPSLGRSDRTLRASVAIGADGVWEQTGSAFKT